jgi:chemotaxis protein methyltransferase CheR
VSETYFLRDARQFAAFAKLLKERAARGLREVRVLSAGCSTGEEAYSVAITIRETLPDAALWNVSVLGADLNGRSLATARRACYTPWSLRETPEPIRQKYFTQEGSNYLLASEISEMVRFEQQNLAAPTSDLWRPESYDVVFLRNVLMYLRAEAARGIVENVARSMALDAHLFLGHAENLRGLSQRFQLIHAHEAFYYRLRSTELPECRSVRPSTQSLERTAATDWYSVINRASARIGALSLDSRAALAHDGSRQQEPMRSVEAPPRFDDTIERVISLIGLERFDDALCLLDTAADTERPQVGLLRAVLQFGAGKLEAALVECGRLLELDDLNAEAHFVTALCREHQGDADAACQHSRTASYLDNDFAMPHLQLGRLARRAGDLRTARRELELALDLLLRETPVRLVLFGGGFDRNALQNVCRGELAACGVDR